MSCLWEYKVKHVSKLRTIEFEGMKVNFLIEKTDTTGMAAYRIHLPKKTVIPPSYHKVAEEIIFVLGGSGTAVLNKKKIRIRKGSAILVQPYTWHSFTSGNSSLQLLAITAPYVDSQTDLYHE